MSVINEESIRYVVIHCSATSAGNDFSAEDINRWHQERGWSEIGYHFVIRRDGRIEIGRDLDETGAHVKGYNKDSWGICLVGGPDSTQQGNDFTEQQWDALTKLVAVMRLMAPNAKILGHRDFPGVNKLCPCFDVQEWLERGGIYQ